MKAFAGIDLGGTNIKFGLADKNGEIIIYRTIPSHADKGREELLKRLGECAEELLLYADENGYEVSYVGIGSPGTVDSEHGKIMSHSPNIPDWEGTEVADRLSGHLNIPVYLGNDANMMALAEAMFGAARGYKDVLCITVGTGVGGGIIIDGKLLIGSTYSAAEIGHVPIIMDGREASTGLKGSLETYSSASELIRITKRLLEKENINCKLAEKLRNQQIELSVKELFKYFDDNDQLALEAVQKQADYLATGLACAVMLLNPQVIVIGGGVADGGGERYIAMVSESLKGRIFEDAARGLNVKKARLGNKAGFIGAAFQREDIPFRKN